MVWLIKIQSLNRRKYRMTKKTDLGRENRIIVLKNYHNFSCFHGIEQNKTKSRNLLYKPNLLIR